MDIHVTGKTNKSKEVDFVIKVSFVDWRPVQTEKM